MKILDSVFTEKQVEEVSDKILKSTVEKFKSELSDNFYNGMSVFLYEHYENISEDIHRKLIDEITEEFVSRPSDYRFYKLRQKLFNENKEILVKELTDEAIQKSVSDVIWEYTDRNYSFSWKWKDAIVKIIIENWHQLKDDERINNGLLRQIEQLRSQVNCLREKFNSLREELNG
jgi:hypothetical protein